MKNMKSIFFYGSKNHFELKKIFNIDFTYYPVILNDYERIFLGKTGNNFSPASIKYRKNAKVRGIIVNLSDKNIKIIDRQEGYRSGRPNNKNYYSFKKLKKSNFVLLNSSSNSSINDDVYTYIKEENIKNEVLAK